MMFVFATVLLRFSVVVLWLREAMAEIDLLMATPAKVLRANVAVI